MIVGGEPSHSRGNSRDRLSEIALLSDSARVQTFDNEPSRMRKLYFLANSKTSSLRSVVAVIPVGLHPNCIERLNGIDADLRR